MFRLPEDRALLNRMGFNNHGAGELAQRLAAAPPDVPIGVNIGKTKVVPAEGAVDDYRESARLLGPAGRLPRRQRQLAEHARTARPAGRRVAAADPGCRAAETTTPVLVKIAPDLSDYDIDEIADLAVELGLAGIVATNTTMSRDGLAHPRGRRDRCRRDLGRRRSRVARPRCCAGSTIASVTGWC